MSYAIRLLLVLTSVASANKELSERLRRVFDRGQENLLDTAWEFLLSEVSPQSVYDFEQKLAEAAGELARDIVQECLNLLEPDEAEQMPHDVRHEGAGYRRLKKTRNAHVSTLFGTIELWRYGYRDWQREGGGKTIFPLESALGLVAGATPALAEVATRSMAEAGATQAAVLERLKRQHHVAWGPERLRQVTQEISQAMEPCRQEQQVLKVLELLEKAQQSRGTCKPVLSVGRDGISLCDYRTRFWEGRNRRSGNVVSG